MKTIVYRSTKIALFASILCVSAPIFSSETPTFLKKNRKAITIAATVVAAGTAAWYGYTWWQSYCAEQEKQAKKKQLEEKGSSIIPQAENVLDDSTILHEDTYKQQSNPDQAPTDPNQDQQILNDEALAKMLQEEQDETSAYQLATKDNPEQLNDVLLFHSTPNVSPAQTLEQSKNTPSPSVTELPATEPNLTITYEDNDTVADDTETTQPRKKRGICSDLLDILNFMYRDNETKTFIQWLTETMNAEKQTDKTIATLQHFCDQYKNIATNPKLTAIQQHISILQKKLS